MTIDPPDFEQMREQMQQRVFSSVAHDLRTPLACIIGSLDILEQMKEKLSSEQKDSLISSAQAEAHRLDSFITQMLEKAKPE